VALGVRIHTETLPATLGGMSAALYVDFVDGLRVATNGGWSLGDARFKQQIAKALGRRVAPLPQGRPKKAKAERRKFSLCPPFCCYKLTPRRTGCLPRGYVAMLQQLKICERPGRVATIHSYCHQDGDWAMAVRDWHVHEGRSEIFLDLELIHGIDMGDRWDHAFKEAAARCAAFSAVGRRARLKIDRRKAWGFESLHGHH
jgi:hypothetical protein